LSSQETFAAKLHRRCEDFKVELKKAKFASISSISEGTEVLVTVGTGEIVRGKVLGVKGCSYFIDYEDRKSKARKELVVNVSSDKHSITSSEGKKAKKATWSSPEGNICIDNGDGSFVELKPVPSDRVRRDSSWLLPWIKKNRTDDLPVFANKDVFQAIVNDFLDEGWLEPSYDLVKSSNDLLLEVAEESLKQSKKLRQYPKLREFLRRLINDRAVSLSASSEKNVEHFIDKERTPYTQDNSLYENLAKHRCAPIFDEIEIALGLHASADSSNIATEGNTSSPTLGGLVPMEQTMNKVSIGKILDALRDKNQRKSVDEHMAEDMQSTLDAYGKVALKRFVDGIPMECWNMFREFPLEVDAALLQVTDTDLNRFLVTGKDIQSRRDDLQTDIKELKAGMEVLESLW
jgi:hypothetical protein